MSRLTEERPRKRFRPMAKATMVPRTVATMVAISPIFRLSPSESQMPGVPHGFVQASREKCSHW